MNKYAIITTEGYCENPGGEKIDNCQFLGRIAAESKKQAINKFWKENEWLSISYFSKKYLFAIQLHESEPV